MYNEDQSITNVLNKWIIALDRLGINYQINIYNDGSCDDTEKRLKDYPQQDRLVVHNKQNSGHGPTILQGYLENSDKKWIFQIDSDDEIGPELFGDLWNKRADYDLLLGRRHGRKSPLSRLFITFVSRMIVKCFFKSGIYDVNTPYRLMRSSVFIDYFRSLPPETFAPNIILSGVATLHNFKIYEMAVPYNFRRTGQVSIDKWKLALVSVRSFVQTIRYRCGSKV